MEDQEERIRRLKRQNEYAQELLQQQEQTRILKERERNASVPYGHGSSATDALMMEKQSRAQKQQEYAQELQQQLELKRKLQDQERLQQSGFGRGGSNAEQQERQARFVRQQGYSQELQQQQAEKRRLQEQERSSGFHGHPSQQSDPSGEQERRERQQRYAQELQNQMAEKRRLMGHDSNPPQFQQQQPPMRQGGGGAAGGANDYFHAPQFQPSPQQGSFQPSPPPHPPHQEDMRRSQEMYGGGFGGRRPQIFAQDEPWRAPSQQDGVPQGFGRGPAMRDDGPDRAPTQQSFLTVPQAAPHAAPLPPAPPADDGFFGQFGRGGGGAPLRDQWGNPVTRLRNLQQGNGSSPQPPPTMTQQLSQKEIYQMELAAQVAAKQAAKEEEKRREAERDRREEILEQQRQEREKAAELAQREQARIREQEREAERERAQLEREQERRERQQRQREARDPPPQPAVHENAAARKRPSSPPIHGAAVVHDDPPPWRQQQQQQQLPPPPEDNVPLWPRAQPPVEDVVPAWRQPKEDSVPAWRQSSKENRADSGMIRPPSTSLQLDELKRMMAEQQDRFQRELHERDAQIQQIRASRERQRSQRSQRSPPNSPIRAPSTSLQLEELKRMMAAQQAQFNEQLYDRDRQIQHIRQIALKANFQDAPMLPARYAPQPPASVQRYPDYDRQLIGAATEFNAMKQVLHHDMRDSFLSRHPDPVTDIDALERQQASLLQQQERDLRGLYGRPPPRPGTGERRPAQQSRPDTASRYRPGTAEMGQPLTGVSEFLMRPQTAELGMSLAGESRFILPTSEQLEAAFNDVTSSAATATDALRTSGTGVDFSHGRIRPLGSTTRRNSLQSNMTIATVQIDQMDAKNAERLQKLELITSADSATDGAELLKQFLEKDR
eukprot:TRINITY_DN3642_c0_g1_i2.p1 TRINITY_DN3642_c0_g1~~TRINITY_DN3642_c0_g1_i2.p1  ORF type:complete len:913 (-),score=272.19 TRINITY_DN3642_c0_g1_i2:361-3045(-)